MEHSSNKSIINLLSPDSPSSPSEETHLVKADLHHSFTSFPGKKKKQEGNEETIDLLACSLESLSVQNEHISQAHSKDFVDISDTDTPPTKEESPNEESDSSLTLRSQGSTYVLPARIASTLYAHQREGIKWLWSLHVKGLGGILGDDMGLGKTMQIAAFLAGLFGSKLIRRAMIVAPKTLIAHWLRELSNVGLATKTRDYSGSGGTARDRALLHVMQVGGVLLTTYDVVRNNWNALQEESYSMNGHSEIDDDSTIWDYVILDEGHFIKNPDTQRAKSLQKIPSSHRIVVSGTPIQNNLREMWALFNFCYPDLLGDKKAFKERYESPILEANDKNATDRQKRIGSGVAQDLRKQIAPFFLRRLKSEVFPTSANHGNEKISRKKDIIVWLRLTECQRQLYSAFLQSDAARLPLGSAKASGKGSALAALTVLKKICDHPCLLTKRAADDITDGMDNMLAQADVAVAQAMSLSLAHILQADKSYKESDAAVSCKLLFILSLLRKLMDEGHRTLVFAQTRKMLNVIEDQLKLMDFRFLRIDGTTKVSDREMLVQEFQKNGQIPVFLLTSQVGGLGLTLTAADRVIIVDPAWNPSTDNQSVDRAYRIGQKKDVLVYRLMTCGTIEEKIYRKQVFKGGLFKVATEHKEQFRYFSQQDLRELLTLPRSGFDISLTQQQLEAEHSSQYKIDTNLKEHIQFLKSQGIAGVSHHDLLFSKQEPIRPLEISCDSRRGNDQGSISTSKQSSSNIEKLHHAKQPTYCVKDIKARTPQSDVQAIIMEDIRRLSKTLADQATISKLPDQGVKIKGRIRVLTNLLQEMNKTNSKTLSNHCDSNDSKIYNGHKVPSKDILSGFERTIIDVEGETPSSNHDNSNAKICNDQKVSYEKALLRGVERTSMQMEWKIPPSYSNNSSTRISNEPRVPSEKENSVSNIDDVISGVGQLDIR